MAKRRKKAAKRYGDPPEVHARRRAVIAADLKSHMARARKALATGDCLMAHDYAMLAARASGRLEAERLGAGRKANTSTKTYRMIGHLFDKLSSKCLKR
jgi:hypothetical protein